MRVIRYGQGPGWCCNYPADFQIAKKDMDIGRLEIVFPMVTMFSDLFEPSEEKKQIPRSYGLSSQVRGCSTYLPHGRFPGFSAWELIEAKIRIKVAAS